jgi:hypothetical protein
LGHGEQRDGWREEERLRPGEEDQHQLVPEGRADRRPRLGVSFEVGSVGVGAQGSRHAQAQGWRVAETLVTLNRTQAVLQLASPKGFVGLILTEAGEEPHGAQELGQPEADNEALPEPVGRSNSLVRRRARGHD